MKKESWSIEITPSTNLFKIDFAGIIAYKDLLLLMVRRDFVATYRQTVLGPLWHLIQPLLTSITMIIVFIRIAKLNIAGNIPPAIYFMSAIIVWNFFASVLNKTSSVFIQNASVFGKVFFPRIIVPFSYFLSSIIAFFFQLFFLFVIALFFYFKQGSGLNVNIYIFTLPLILLALGIQGMSFGMIISSITVKYRDFVYLVSFGIQLLMYLSPVIYTIQYISDPDLKRWMLFNPMAPFIEMFRYSITGVGEINLTFLLSGTVITVAVFLVAVVVFNKTEKNFIDTI